MRTATNGNEEGEIETWLGDPKLAILLGGGWACFAASKNWRQDFGGNTGKNEEKRWLGSIDETDWRLSLLFASCWYFHGSLPAPSPRNFNLSERRRLFLPPWLCGPTVPLMRAETRVGCAVCMPSRVGPQSQGKAARPSMRTFVLGFPLWAFGRERAGWLAGSCCWADGTREQDNGQGRLKAGPLFLSRPLRPSRRSLFRSFL